MPSELKQVVTHTFTKGLQRDLAHWVVPNDAYIDALNIRIFQAGDQFIATNPLGNTEIPFTLPEGDNYCLGSYAYTEGNKFFFFNWNANDFHGIYYYDYLLNKVFPVMVNLTDTGGIDILQFGRRTLILMIDVIKNNKGQDLLYWCDGEVKQKKINVQKAMDKSDAGYGMIITATDINAYKLAANAPVTEYFTDTTRNTNFLYGHLYKASLRHWFDDGELNNWSEFSTVALPVNNGFTGNPAVTNINNTLQITIETGPSIVRKLEIALKDGSNDFVSIVVLDKDKLAIPDNSTYVYNFYNDNTSYSGLDQAKVYRAYSYMQRKAALQAFCSNAMVYGKGLEGFPAVEVDINSQVIYSDLFVESSVVNALNSPQFIAVLLDHDFTREGKGRRRNSLIRITVGADVKAGNKFDLYANNGESDRNIFFTYTANNSDTAISVANAFKQQLVATGRILNSSEDLPDTDIWDNTIVSGDVTFEFIWRGRFAENATTFSGQVSPVSVQTLKDNGQSVLTQKSGDSVNYGVLYWDEDTYRSNVYTSPGGFVSNSFVTETNGFKKIEHRLSILNPPPVWATHWELVRTTGLTYGTLPNDYIQILIQKAIESQSTTDTDYVDLVIGSLYTYQKMYPNTIVRYDFQKNDRVRLIKKETGGTFYPFTETVVLDFKEVGVTETIDENITTNNTNTVTIGGTTSSDNIGRYIVIDGVEREIIGVPTGTTYTLSGLFGTSQTYTSFQIVDKRGIIRVRKPLNVTIEDNSLIEVYKPTQNVETAQKNFYLFGQKYAIINPGTDSRAHSGNVQNQDPLNPATTPAIVSITQGTSYVRNRQLPTNNAIPGTQVIVDLIEDNSYSDSYESALNNNGKIAPEDDGSGEIRFGSRLRYSNNYIEGTRINGLNDFDNLDREDYNDPWGDFMLLKFRDRLLYAFKQFKMGYIPVLNSIVTTSDGTSSLAATTKFLNQYQTFAWEGGIGNNPESYASDQTWQYVLSPNSGTDCRIGGDGVLPTSHQFGLSQTVRDYIDESQKYGAFIFGGFDRQNSERILAFEPYNLYIYKGDITEATWELYDDALPLDTTYEITTQPVNGDASVPVAGVTTYTPDTDYLGNDPFYFRWLTDEGWTAPKKVCVTVDEENIPPLPTLYYNAEVTVNITKNDCPAGYHGSDVAYTVPDLKYSSPFSQLDADAQALDEITALGQTYANESGTCIQNAPDPFDFIDVTGADVNTLTESNAVTVSNDYPDYTIVPTSGEYEINNSGTWSAVSGIVVAGDSVKIRRLSSPSYNTLVSMSLNIGGVSDVWNITTQNGSPTPFTFTDVTGAEVSTLYVSNTVTMAGYVGSLPISVTDGEVSINGGAWTSSPTTISVGDNLAVRRTSSSEYGATVGATVTVGTYSDTFSITNRVANNVSVNYAILFGIDPTTATVIAVDRIRGGVTTTQLLSNGAVSGTLPVGSFVEGDTIIVYQIAYAAFRWAPTSNANLTMNVNLIEYYNGDVTDQTPVNLQNTTPLVIPAGTVIIDVTSTGSSTAVGYQTQFLRANSYIGNGEFSIDLTDNAEAGLGLQDLEPNNGTADFAFNVKTGAGDLTVTITNNKATAIDYSLAGDGGYLKTGTIAGLGNISYADVPKGNVTVEVSDNNGAIACGVTTPYSGGQTYPTIQEITLGSGTGTVTLNYNAFSVPDKFVVVFDGVEVINTGYRGDAGEQAALDAALATYGAPSETIAGPGSGSANFVKSTATTTATVYVYGPMAGTAWQFTLECPV